MESNVMICENKTMNEIQICYKEKTITAELQSPYLRKAHIECFIVGMG